MPASLDKRYLGDGVYADYDGYGVVLTTENGITTTNRIVLEPEIIIEVERYFLALRQAIAKARTVTTPTTEE
jgi:hypothetical protein